MILKCEDVCKSYRQGEALVQALYNISFSLEPQTSLSIVGPSGSGKTTLLSLMAGLDSPSSGKIEINGSALQDLSEAEKTAFRAENMGIVFQQFHLMPYLTALENVSLPLDILGHDQPEKRAKQWLERVGLGDRANHLPHQLSGGESQRVAIARASVIEPAILLADEPSGNLDTETGLNVMDLLFELSDESGRTLILVTHDRSLADRCQKQIHLVGGRLQ